MEAFEEFVALAMESEGLLVAGPRKYPVSKLTRKAGYPETQTHGYEVDLVGVRSDRLVLATVKSFFGSRGVVAEHVRGEHDNRVFNARYALLNDPVVRDGVVAKAAEQLGFRLDQVEVRLYAGKFAGKRHEGEIREWAAGQNVGGGPIQVHGPDAVVDKVRLMAERTEYRDSAVLATLKLLNATGDLSPRTPLA
ncbi:hypothetical protein GCM10025867_49840 (plasmid) [Frondihabitans sucicola]|uniref:Uncharacterized protein n=1 Tax=Frondihabitans sucicola TaxID=1268041 RepID=A0ABN6Y9Q7_9MICO|nr:hypothetical protein [Frondihabitans sucicola]BDZ52743.1 hypothetical protein GCM10025867_49840 [Frondihabitans sucicola]